MANKADNYFAIIPHWVLFANISPQAVRLYCVLRTYADNRTLESWPSRNTLAEDLQVDSVKTIDRAVKELVDLGAISVERRFKNGEPQSNLYTLMSQVAPRMSLPSDTDGATTPQESRTNYNQLTKTKELRENKPDGLQIKELMKIYFENYTGDLQPSRGQIAGQLQSALKQIPYEKLEVLVRQVAIEGQTISRNTLIFAQSKLQPKATTPTRPKFDPAEFENPNAVPMPKNFRDIALGK